MLPNHRFKSHRTVLSYQSARIRKLNSGQAKFVHNNRATANFEGKTIRRFGSNFEFHVLRSLVVFRSDLSACNTRLVIMTGCPRSVRDVEIYCLVTLMPRRTFAYCVLLQSGVYGVLLGSIIVKIGILNSLAFTVRTVHRWRCSTLMKGTLTNRLNNLHIKISNLRSI